MTKNFEFPLFDLIDAVVLDYFPIKSKENSLSRKVGEALFTELTMPDIKRYISERITPYYKDGRVAEIEKFLVTSAKTYHLYPLIDANGKNNAAIQVIIDTFQTKEEINKNNAEWIARVKAEKATSKL
jgi:hypothetical protein